MCVTLDRYEFEFDCDGSFVGMLLQRIPIENYAFYIEFVHTVHEVIVVYREIISTVFHETLGFDHIKRYYNI